MKKLWVLEVALVIICGFALLSYISGIDDVVYDDETLMNAYIEYAYGDGYCGILNEYGDKNHVTFMIYTKDGEPYSYATVHRDYARQLCERG